MRIIIQRVKSSQVTVNGEIVGKIGRGLNLLVGIADTDTDAELDWMVRKCLELRLFGDEEGNTVQLGISGGNFWCVETLQCNFSTKIIGRYIILTEPYWMKKAATVGKNPYKKLAGSCRYQNPPDSIRGRVQLDTSSQQNYGNPCAYSVKNLNSCSALPTKTIQSLQPSNYWYTEELFN